MNQSCVKFISHMASFLFFIIMLIATYLEYSVEVEIEDFKNSFPSYKESFETYSKREDLPIHLSFSNFVIRKHVPSALDIIISIWIIGKILANNNLIFFSSFFLLKDMPGMKSEIYLNVEYLTIYIHQQIRLTFA